jgi:hypothetical protein
MNSGFIMMIIVLIELFIVVGWALFLTKFCIKNDYRCNIYKTRIEMMEKKYKKSKKESDDDNQ